MLIFMALLHIEFEALIFLHYPWYFNQISTVKLFSARPVTSMQDLSLDLVIDKVLRRFMLHDTALLHVLLVKISLVFICDTLVFLNLLLSDHLNQLKIAFLFFLAQIVFIQRFIFLTKVLFLSLSIEFIELFQTNRIENHLDRILTLQLNVTRVNQACCR